MLKMDIQMESKLFIGFTSTRNSNIFILKKIETTIITY